MNITEAIRGRASTRMFTDQAVSRDVIHQILDAARWAPSGVNTQPWQVAVVMGDAKRKIGDALVEARSLGQVANPDYKYYAERLTEPYRSRQKACGLALYGALGIGRDDTQDRMAQWLKNYHGFGAPARAEYSPSWLASCIVPVSFSGKLLTASIIHDLAVPLQVDFRACHATTRRCPFQGGTTPKQAL